LWIRNDDLDEEEERKALTILRDERVIGGGEVDEPIPV